MYEEAGLKSRLACKYMLALQPESTLGTWSTPQCCTTVMDSLPSRHDSVVQYVAIVIQIVAVRCRFLKTICCGQCVAGWVSAICFRTN